MNRLWYYVLHMCGTVKFRIVFSRLFSSFVIAEYSVCPLDLAEYKVAIFFARGDGLLPDITLLGGEDFLQVAYFFITMKDFLVWRV